MKTRSVWNIWGGLLLLLMPGLAFSADFDPHMFSLIWGIPFVGILLSIALLPALAPHFWHLHQGKTAAFWGILFIVPFALSVGLPGTGQMIVHTLMAEYVPFILLLFALYTVSGGILVWGHLHGTPRLNTGILALGALLASCMGTTGAAMLLIRPLLRANENRRHQVHSVVFFIFVVANVGGGMTPLGDPPLFLGFLKGVDFLWTIKAMAPPVLFSVAYLLGVYFLLDSWFYSKEDEVETPPNEKDPLRIFGAWNFLLIGAIVGAVLLSGIWKSEVTINIFGTHVALQDMTRDVLLLIIALVSLWLTPKQVRSGNEFTWFPIVEVAKLFAAIFLTITPVIAMLKLGMDGPMSKLVAMVTAADGSPINGMYFWMTGILSSFLDNAPTYLVFFNLASGDPVELMGPLAHTLVAISMASVFMGANTYIGNAPNFMVKAMAEDRKVKMPSFFGYMLWSITVLVPLFIALDLIYFNGLS